MNFLAALIPLLAGFTQPLKDWFNYKQETQKKDQEYKLALLAAQIEQARAEAVSESTQLQARLAATSQDFKRNTFYFLCLPVIISTLCPSWAVDMWHNFSLMPDWFQWLFISVYSAIWGLPVAKGGYGAITDLLGSRREYKLEKARLDRDAVFKVLRNKVFLKGLNQAQVDAVNSALDEGER